MASTKRINTLLWASAAAAATGVLAVAAIIKWKERSLASMQAATRLRDVQDVLTDCYRKIHEIEDHLPQALSLPAQRRTTMSVRPLSSSAPLMDS